MNHLKFVLLAALCGVLSVANGKMINCYYGSWAHYRPDEGAFKVKNIDPKLCTHLSYSFYGIDDKSGAIKTLDSWLTEPSNLNQVKNITELKNINPDLKIMLVVGGWNECGTDKYSRMAANPTMRKAFIDSASKLISERGFDGLDLDWEYPVTRAGTPQDKKNFVTLLSEIHAAMKSMGKEFGIAVAAGEGIASQAYDIPGIAKNVDFINVMTYDFASYFDHVVGFNAPLEGQGTNNVKSAIKYWMNQGAPASKLLLGLAFYGRTFKLADPNQYSIGSAVVTGLEGGPITREMGYYGYNEICKFKKSYKYEWSTESSVPFLHKDTNFISYDDVKSLELKVDYSNSLNLAGVMIWSIETDDFHGYCGGGVFPLLNAINKRIKNPNSPSMARGEDEQPYLPEPASKPVYKRKASAPVQPPQSNNSGRCKLGIHSHPTDCTKFLQCDGTKEHEMSCAGNLHFDAAAGTCNYPEQANCQH